MLGPAGSDFSRVDEIAARVWYALVRNDGELLGQFDRKRETRLGGFLHGLARIEVLQYFRTEYRRRARETACCSRANGGSAVSDWQVAAMIEDFATTLSATEQEFLEEHLLGQSQEEGHDLSDSSVLAALPQDSLEAEGLFRRRALRAAGKRPFAILGRWPVSVG